MADIQYPNNDKDFTKIPNQILRSTAIDGMAKAVMCIILMHNPSFPSYPKLMELTGMSRGKLWKVLCLLERNGLIIRYRKGRKIYYETPWTSSSGELIEGSRLVHLANGISSRGELIRPQSVHVVNPNKTPLPKTPLIRTDFFKSFEEGIED